MQRHPHTPDELERALERFEVPAQLLPMAALHLATPVDSIVGLDVSIEDGMWQWRGSSVRGPGVVSARIASERAVSLVSMAWRIGEAALDLGGPCLKPVRSGAHILVAGSFLYGVPVILCDLAVDDPVQAALAYLPDRTTTSGLPASAGSSDGNDAGERTLEPMGAGVVERGGVRYLVHGDGRVVWIHTETTTATPSTFNRVDRDEIAAIISDQLGSYGMEAASIGSRLDGTVDIDYVGRVDEIDGVYEVIVPCTAGNGLSIGAPHGAAVPAAIEMLRERDVPWYGLQQFEPVEPARFEPGWVARHRESGMYVIIRPAEGGTGERHDRV